MGVPECEGRAGSTSHVEPAKKLSWLLKLGLLPTDAVVSQRRASKELSQLMRLDLMLTDTAVSSPSWVLTLRFLLLTSVWYVRCGIGSLVPAWHTADGQTGHRGSSIAEFDLRAPCRNHPHLSSNASDAQKCFSRHRVQIDWSRNRFRNLTFELPDGNKQSHVGRELPKGDDPKTDQKTGG